MDGGPSGASSPLQKERVPAQLSRGLPFCTSNADYDSRTIPPAFKLSVLNICDASGILKHFSIKVLKMRFSFTD